jgi:hypothetical protein
MTTRCPVTGRYIRTARLASSPETSGIVSPVWVIALLIAAINLAGEAYIVFLNGW